jgi:hypothetical protein
MRVLSFFLRRNLFINILTIFKMNKKKEKKKRERGRELANETFIFRRCV